MRFFSAPPPPPFFFFLSIFSVVLFSSILCELGDSSTMDMRVFPGAIVDSKNSIGIDSAASFAVNEYNKKENAHLELERVLKAKEQHVAGTMYFLTLEVIDAGKKKIYEAKVWEQAGTDSMELLEFKDAGDSTVVSTSSDLGVKQGD